jgi:hypothetical protein
MNTGKRNEIAVYLDISAQVYSDSAIYQSLRIERRFESSTKIDTRFGTRLNSPLQFQKR